MNALATASSGKVGSRLPDIFNAALLGGVLRENERRGSLELVYRFMFFEFSIPFLAMSWLPCHCVAVFSLVMISGVVVVEMSEGSLCSLRMNEPYSCRYKEDSCRYKEDP